MKEEIKQFLLLIGRTAACLIWLIALDCNTVFPATQGQGAYAVFNVVVCGLAFPTVLKFIKSFKK